MPNPGNIEKHKMKKGETLNPSGRPKGSRNRSTIIREIFEIMELSNNSITGKNEKLSQEQIMTLAVLKKAKAGDVRAYQALMDSGYGQPKQQIEMSNEEGGVFKIGNQEIQF